MKIQLLVALGLVLGAAATQVARAADDHLDAETKARVERFEKGPATIDVSKYPDGIKENYEVFSHEVLAVPQAEPPDQLGLRAAGGVVALHQADDAQARLGHQRRRRQEDL